MTHDKTQSALDAFTLLKQRSELADFEGEPYTAIPNVVFHYFLEHEETIRHALTEAAELKAQNEELLEALKDLRDAVESTGYPHESVKRADKAIAEAKKGA